MSFFKSLLELVKPAPPPDPDVLKALDRVGVLVDPALPSAAGFSKILTLPVRNALDYCRWIVDQIPGPYPIDRQSFSSDPLVHALFATADDIHHMLGKSPQVREYLDAPGSLEGDCFYALVAARQQSKKTLGVAMEGDMVRNDVPVEYLYFSDHVVIDAGSTPEACRNRIWEKAFDGLLRSFRTHLDDARARRQELREGSAVERDQIAVLRGQGTVVEIDHHTRRLEELQKNLSEIVETLQAEEIVAALANFLMVPETAMQIVPVTLKADRTGIITPSGSDDSDADTLNFQQFTGRDRRSYMVLIACIRRDDAAAAVSEMKDLQRRSLII